MRIVAAADEERRRIERDLHDGAQQRLVAPASSFGARNAARRPCGSELDLVLAEAVDEFKVAVDELRELARGVHPATHRGRPRRRARVAGEDGPPVSLDVSEGRFPAHVEATAYFVACEALANIVKHARVEGAGDRGHPKRRPRRPGRGRWRRRRARRRGPASAGLRTASRRSEAARRGEPRRRRNSDHRRDSVRVVIAEDSVLLREGLARVLAEGNIEVAAQVGDADALHHAVHRERPDVVIVDVRMPRPKRTKERAPRARSAPGIRRWASSCSPRLSRPSTPSRFSASNRRALATPSRPGPRD